MVAGHNIHRIFVSPLVGEFIGIHFGDLRLQGDLSQRNLRCLGLDRCGFFSQRVQFFHARVEIHHQHHENEKPCDEENLPNWEKTNVHGSILLAAAKVGKAQRFAV